MFRFINQRLKLKLDSFQLNKSRCLSYNFSKISIPSNYVLSSEVKSGLLNEEPIIALESTIISHGMPYPSNLSTALEVESIVRSNKCIPCTIAILDNKVYFGLSEQLFDRVAKTGLKANKVSRRDIVQVLTKGGVGSTTVSGTLALANQLNLKMMVTGGLGGVHKDGQNSLDISADLIELGRTPMTVVCSGVKSILDIERSLEVLETQGVAVVTFAKNSKKFPAFFLPKSQFDSPIHIDSFEQLVQFQTTFNRLNLGSGAIVAVPIPEVVGEDPVDFEKIVEEAIHLSVQDQIQGKLVTPYLLDKVNQLSKGTSLQANIRLVKNNAHVGSKLLLHSFQGWGGRRYTTKTSVKPEFRITVVGSSSIDVVATTSQLQPNTSVPGRVHFTVGGVGLNLSLSLTQFQLQPQFFSIIGNGPLAQQIIDFCKGRGLGVDDIVKVGNPGQSISEDLTSVYHAIHDQGDLNLAIYSAPLLDQLHLNQLQLQSQHLKLLLLDANLPTQLIHQICCLKSQLEPNRFLIFEPTSTPKSIKVLQFLDPVNLDQQKSTLPNLITPNLYELIHMYNYLLEKYNPTHLTQCTTQTPSLEQIQSMANHLHRYIPFLIVKLGKVGCLVTSHQTHTLIPSKRVVENPINVSGAGDSLVATVTALIYQYLHKYSSMDSFTHTQLKLCTEVGMEVALNTLMSMDTTCPLVNPQMLDKVQF